ncbi:sialate O-acetylesterase [Acrasis kona]|uniref:Sialate O-acetylesterase n=1 Tax=Acrasis kona TaxID=1008807 RepID=A0AAW2ZMW4_9EUKA
MKIHFFLLFIVALVSCTNINYKLLGNNMVLQRDSPYTKIWGVSDSQVVNIGLLRDGKLADSYDTKVIGKKWVINLKPYPSSGPYQIVVKTDETVSYDNVMFGDVYLCSGQSNMEMSVKLTDNSTAEIADSINYPNLRLFHVKHNQQDKPQDNVEGEWVQSSPSGLGGDWEAGFSAACYYFGREVYKSLDGKIPIGLIESNWGGTLVEAWMSPEALKACNDTIRGDGPNDQSHLWNGQIVPLLNYNIKAALWYQGEANVDFGGAQLYKCSFPSMITDWRKNWNIGNFPFYFVQLAGYAPQAERWSQLRLAQIEATKLSNVYFATAMDIGDPTDIHPRNKQEVGRRLSLIARNQIYGQPIAYKGPTLNSATVTFSQDGHLAFVNLNIDNVVGELLQFKTNKCTRCCSVGTLFSVVTNSRGAVAPLDVSVKGNRIVLFVERTSRDEVVRSVRYAMDAYAECVYRDGSTGLPMNTFEFQV